MMIIEVPLPKPLSVIFSPSHITNNVPTVKNDNCRNPEVMHHMQESTLQHFPGFLDNRYKLLPGKQ